MKLDSSFATYLNIATTIIYIQLLMLYRINQYVISGITQNISHEDTKYKMRAHDVLYQIVETAEHFQQNSLFFHLW